LLQTIAALAILLVHFGFGTAAHLAAFALLCLALHVPMGMRLSFALQPIRVGIRNSALGVQLHAGLLLFICSQ
jgi:hypothetical protein